MTTEFVEEASEITTTTSWLRMWWLTHLNGYRVCAKRLEPKETLWGNVRLVSRWHLSVSRRLGSERG